MTQMHLGEAEAVLFYEEFGQGTPLLLIHGMLQTGRDYAQAALQLSNTYHVVVPDLRGYGRSTPRPRSFPPDFYRRDAADMIALLRHLRLPGWRIVGCGDGGEVALLVALEAPDLVRAVVAVDVIGVFPPALREMLPQLGRWASDPKTPYLARRMQVIREYGPEVVEKIWAAWRAAAEIILDTGGNINRDQAGDIACPVLILNQVSGKLNTPELGQALAAALPQGELRIMPTEATSTQDPHNFWLTSATVEWLAAH